MGRFRTLSGGLAIFGILKLARFYVTLCKRYNYQILLDIPADKSNQVGDR